MTIAYESGAYDTAVAISNPEFSAPFEGVNARYVLTQDFMQNHADYTPLALNTAHPVYSDYVLVAESEQRPLDGNKVEWTRTYAKVPTTYSEPGGNFAYHFIGFVGFNQTSGLVVETQYTGRERFTRVVPSSVTREFFLVGTGGAYASFDAIPVISETRYVMSDDDTLEIDYLANDDVLVVPTSPDRDEYDALITSDTDPTSYSIIAEASRLTRWMGNIYLRETTRVKAL